MKKREKTKSIKQLEKEKIDRQLKSHSICAKRYFEKKEKQRREEFTPNGKFTITEKGLESALRYLIKKTDKLANDFDTIGTYLHIPLIIAECWFKDHNLGGNTTGWMYQDHQCYTILISKGISEERKVEALFHEICHLNSLLTRGHAFNRNMDIEEMFCYSLGRLVSNIVKDYKLR